MAHGSILNKETDISNLLPIDGSKTMTGALAMGNHKITGLSNGTASTDAATYGQLTSVSISASRITGTLSTSNIPNLDASKITSGILPVARGGTGSTTIPDNRIMYGNGTGAVSTMAFPSNNNSILSQNTSGAPTWKELNDFFVKSTSATMSYEANETSVTYSNSNIRSDSTVFVSLRATDDDTYNTVAGMNLYFRSQTTGSITFGVANPINQAVSIPITVVIAR